MPRKSLDEIVIESTKKDVDALIMNIVNKWPHKGERDELLGEVYLAFMQAWRSFKPDKACFTTWLVTKANYHLRQLRRDDAKRHIWDQVSLDSLDTEIKEMISAYEPPQFKLSEFIEELSEDAREVVKLLFESPMDLQAMFWQRGEPSPKNIRESLISFLKELKWGMTRISEAFSEIMEILG